MVAPTLAALLGSTQAEPTGDLAPARRLFCHHTIRRSCFRCSILQAVLCHELGEQRIFSRFPGTCTLACARRRELAASISEQKAQLEVAAAQKAAVESDLANEKIAASAAAANAEATAADLRTQLEQSQATCGEMGEARTVVEKQHAEVVRGLEDQIADLKRQVENAAREAERQAEMHQIALDNSKGQQALATQEAAEQAKKQEERMAALMESNEEAATEITNLGKDVETRLQQLTEAQKEIQTLEAEVTRVEAELKTTLEKNVRRASQQLELPILF